MEKVYKIIIYVLTFCFLGLCVVSGIFIEQGIKEDNKVPFIIGIVMIFLLIFTAIRFIESVMKEDEND